MQVAKSALEEAVVWPVKRAAVCRQLHLRANRGVLLHGPPGCGKTRLARACAHEARGAFIALSGADVYAPYLGEAEATVRRAFHAADAAAPCILFFDEVDALVGDRTARAGEGAEMRVLATFLTCLDGIVGPRAGVVVIGATNRPHTIDRALLRPGRLETSVYVGLPGIYGRVAILVRHGCTIPLHADVDLAVVGAATRGFSGAELAKVLRDAALAAIHTRSLSRVLATPSPCTWRTTAGDLIAGLRDAAASQNIRQASTTTQNWWRSVKRVAEARTPATGVLI
mmetsp:Transcript_13673/g.42273  ORF Transcript_13673/g.42273 Transcript_13673/m.42273 type:complete len:284 (+) Transcript_13673:859-1710(+)